MKPVLIILLSLGLFTAVTGFSLDSQARIVLIDPPIAFESTSSAISVQALRDFVLNISKANPQDPFMACAEVLDVKSTYLCISATQLEMNQTFTRAGFFWGTGKGYPKGTILPNSDSTLALYNQMINGQNLTSEILEEFFTETLANADPDKSPNELEREFHQSFMNFAKIANRKSSYVVIGVSADLPDYLQTLHHEIHHSKYYLWKAYKSAVDNFWKTKVTDHDKMLIRSALGDTYNSSNESVMIDEFQAYMLEAGTSDNLLKAFIPKYRTGLQLSVKELKN